MPVEQVSPRVWWMPPGPPDRPSLCAVVGDRWTLALDAGSSRAHAREFLAGLPTRPAAVAYTHSHWDHVFGGVEIGGFVIAHTLTAQRLGEMALRDWNEETNVSDHIREELPAPRVVEIAPADIVFDERIERPVAAKATKTAPAAEDNFFARLGGEVWKELRQLVVVRKVEAPEPPLLPPQQAWFLRENLKLRLLNARLALLTRDEAGYREDLRVAQGWIQRYFDARAKASQAALVQMKQLSAASISFEPPSIVDSLEAVRGFKARREQGRS